MDSFGKVAVQDCESTENETELRCIWLLHEACVRSRVNGIISYTNNNENNYTSIFFLLFLARKQGLDNGKFTGAALFSL